MTTLDDANISALSYSIAWPKFHKQLRDTRSISKLSKSNSPIGYGIYFRTRDKGFHNPPQLFGPW